MLNRNRIVLTLTPVIVAWTCSLTTQAEILTYGLSGTITWIENETDLPIEEVFPIGMPWEVIYTFDSDVPGKLAFPGWVGKTYPFNQNAESAGRIFEMKVTFGDQVYEQIVQPEGRMGDFWIVDATAEEEPVDDIFAVRGFHFPDVGGIEIPFVRVDLRNLKDPGNPHSGIGIDYQPDLDLYWSRGIEIWSSNYTDFWGNYYSINGRADRFFVVPEPGATFIVVWSAIAIAARRLRP